jgi:hypothetical protein
MPKSNNKESLSLLTLKYAIGAITVLVALTFVSKIVNRESAKYSPEFVKHIKTLVRYASQWSTVSRQDENPLLSLIHVTNALSYAYAARKLVPSAEVERIANVNLDELIYILEDEQMQAMRRINEVCPELQPEGVFAAYTGWLA